MDMKRGTIYPDADAARAAGVPAERMAEVDIDGDIIEVKNGPFKGRKYEVENGKRGRRRTDLEG